jgi:hypothetical protein
MKKLISSKEALDILARSAPRAWCKRLLLQLIFEGHLFAFFQEGHWRGFLPLGVLLDSDELAPVDGERFWEAVRKRWGMSAPKSMDDLVQGREGTSLAHITGGRWYADSTYSDHQVGFGYFYHADSIDFEEGTLSIDEIYPFEAVESYFLPDDAMFQYRKSMGDDLFSWFVCKVDFGGMAFEGSAIELIAGMEATSGISSQPPKGRPTKWDWAGAMMAVVRLANAPDGITQARGEQARVENAIASWFIESSGDQPHQSQIRDYAARLMAYLAEKPPPTE